MKDKLTTVAVVGVSGTVSAVEFGSFADAPSIGVELIPSRFSDEISVLFSDMLNKFTQRDYSKNES
jgi:hypothetical protein